MFSQMAINQKILEAWPFFRLKVRNLGSSLYIITIFSTNEEATLTMAKAPFLLKHTEEMWLINGE